MELNDFRESLFKLALDKGCEAARTHYSAANSGSVRVMNGEIESFVSARDVSLSLKVKVNGREGTASTEVLENPEALVDRAIDNARTIEVEDEMPWQGASEYERIEPEKDYINELSDEERIALALSIEKRVKEMDERIVRVGACEVAAASYVEEMHNTLGLEAKSQKTLSLMFLEPIMKIGDDEKNSFAWRLGTEPIDVDGLCREAIDEVLLQFNASPVPAGKYRILLRNSAASDLLSVFSGVFSADNTQKGLSLLAGREGEKIASECVTIMDDPFYPGNKNAFDYEGVPCKKKAVVNGGVLDTLLHSLKTAKKADTTSTGNGAGGGGVTTTNFYIMPGEKSFSELIKELGNGLIITDLSGLHCGVNDVSGDFSLLSHGMLVENGEVVRNVDQITVAGNFFEVLKNVEMVGSDLKLSIPGGLERTGSPSLILKELTVAG